ncbi:MarR family winged helix-turn-helix transcriptional regulator [uncultured Clostridium sp.]|jgi:DNA-binding MarR family transcriptional regulator|uniref:MarR family winged helix-turn-helix transcriptional regulator n=1 Tax=uncultured Clostridium sp. TaxID=59620 RepID=UPI002601E6FE|nr:MarR family winged helix-turn-helix transcriptional regulator [uncultured Clostridium sp.]
MLNSDLDRRLTKELSFGKVLESIGRHRHYYVGKKLEKFDLKRAEYRLLIQVYIEEGCCQDDIVNNLGIDKFDASKGIKSLIEKGYILKQKDEIDKRRCRLFPTDKANEIREEFTDILVDSAGLLTEGISTEDKEVALRVMIKMAQNMYTQSCKLRAEK